MEENKIKKNCCFEASRWTIGRMRTNVCIPSYAYEVIQIFFKLSFFFLTVILTWIFVSRQFPNRQMEMTVVFLSANMQTSFLKESHLPSDRYMTKLLYLYFSQTRFLTLV